MISQTFSIFSVTVPSASIVLDETNKKATYNFNIPKGATGAKGETPLCVAIVSKSTAAAAVLIEKGANVDSTTVEGNSGPRPLQLAVDISSKEVVALLLHKAVGTKLLYCFKGILSCLVVFSESPLGGAEEEPCDLCLAAVARKRYLEHSTRIS